MRLTAVLSTFVVLCTAWALMVPAIAITGDRAQPDAGFFGEGGGLVAGVAPALNGADAEADEEQFEDGSLNASGDSYEVTVQYDADAQIPADAELRVREIAKDTEDF